MLATCLNRFSADISVRVCLSEYKVLLWCVCLGVSTRRPLCRSLPKSPKEVVPGDLLLRQGGVSTCLWTQIDATKKIALSLGYLLEFLNGKDLSRAPQGHDEL